MNREIIELNKKTNSDYRSEDAPLSDIVITGMGCVTPAGKTVREFWESCKKGASGIKHVQKKNSLCSSYRVPYAGIVADLESTGGNRLVDMGVTAVKEALDNAHLLTSSDNYRINCILSTSKPNLFFSENTGNSYYESLSSQVVKKIQLMSTVQNPIGSCVSGISSLLLAKNMLLENVSDIVVCGAFDSSLHPMLVSAYTKMGVLLSNRKYQLDSFCPYDTRRNGFFPGEGGGVLILEKKNHAIKRGVHIYVFLEKIALLSEAYHEVTMHPEGKQIVALLETLLQKNGGYCIPDYISLHGTATKTNDSAETTALKKVFKKNAYSLCMSAIKPFTGHMVSGSSIVEIIASILALETGFIPPTLFLKEADPYCDLDYSTKPKTRENICSAVSLSYGFGSLFGGVLLKKFNN
ncbi:beta-ketoacyl synthase N-terminal-like domain-containing protein [Chlamydiota bacterium]